MGQPLAIGQHVPFANLASPFLPVPLKQSTLSSKGNRQVLFTEYARTPATFQSRLSAAEDKLNTKHAEIVDLHTSVSSLSSSQQHSGCAEINLKVKQDCANQLPLSVLCSAFPQKRSGGAGLCWRLLLPLLRTSWADARELGKGGGRQWGPHAAPS